MHVCVNVERGDLNNGAKNSIICEKGLDNWIVRMCFPLLANEHTPMGWWCALSLSSSPLHSYQSMEISMLLRIWCVITCWNLKCNILTDFWETRLACGIPFNGEIDLGGSFVTECASTVMCDKCKFIAIDQFEYMRFDVLEQFVNSKRVLQ